MQAFHGKQETKDFYVNRVKKHIEADNLIRGTGWRNGKGCAVGCTLEDYNHEAYETELGIPEWLAGVEDSLFEGMSVEKSKTWPKVFLESITPGADLEQIKAPFTIFVLESALEAMKSAVFDKDKFPDVQKAIDESEKAILDMIRCHREGLDLSAAWSAAESAAASAWSAASAAESAAASARSAASAAASAKSAKSAAWSAAWSAASAAASAAAGAAASARGAESAAASARGARSAAYDKFADKLIELLKACE